MAGNQRRLAAIVAADVAEYSRLVSEDEDAAIEALRGHRAEVFERRLREFGGRIANTAGDSLLMEFPSIIEALRCAMAIQADVARRNEDIPPDRRMLFRMGVNVGDVVSDGRDLLGDGVNVAARLEEHAPVGGICISRAARDQVRDRMALELEDLGEVAVKNIARPVRAFRVIGLGEAAGAPFAVGRRRKRRLATLAGILLLAAAGVYLVGDRLPLDVAPPAALVGSEAERPGIAVLTFANQSDDPDQDYLADGIAEDISTDLSKVDGLFVASRASARRYGARAEDPAGIAEALNVGYILEGSVRRAEDRVRITATLIDARSGGQLWAERFDRDADDIFAIQDEISQHVVARLSESLQKQSLSRSARTYTPNIAAYDLYIRGRAKRLPPTPANLDAALALFEKAIAVDPKFAGGYAGAAFVHLLRYGGGDDRAGSAEDTLALALELAEKAVALDPTFGPGWGSLAEAYLRKGRFDAALDAMQRALETAPSDSLMRANYGRMLGQVGLAQDGIEQVKRAMRMSPDSLPMLYFLGANYRAAGEYDRAIESLIEHRKRLGGQVVPAPTAQLIAAYAEAGRLGDAKVEAQKLLETAPGFTVAMAARSHLYRDPGEQARYAAALKAAGIPE